MIVSDVRSQWKSMQGPTLRVKLINAYLTYQFLTARAPADECLSEAVAIVEGADISSTLTSSFATFTPLGGSEDGKYTKEEMLPEIEEAVKDILLIMEKDPEEVAESLSW